MKTFNISLLPSLRSIGAFIFVATLSLTSFAQEKVPLLPNLDAMVVSAKTTLSKALKANAINPSSNEAAVVKAFVERLKSEKIEHVVHEFAPGRHNLVARLKGNGNKRPLMLVAHSDVVGVQKEKWTVPPYELTEKDGYLYGRGVVDDLGRAVINTEVFIAIKKSGLELDRDLVLLLVGGEESGGDGISALLKDRGDLISDAEFALNEGGETITRDDGSIMLARLQVGEKIYQDFLVKTKGPAGHSSLPKMGNPIFRLSRALARLENKPFDEKLIPATRAYFRERAALESPQVAKAMRQIVNAKGKLPEKALAVLRRDPFSASRLATTCVPTLLNAGIRANVLPSEATASINCRILPGETVESTKSRLEKLIADPEVEVVVGRLIEANSGKMSPETGVVVDAVRKVYGEQAPAAVIIPTLGVAASDSRFLREIGIAAYGLRTAPISEADFSRIHGDDERIKLDSMKVGMDLLFRLVKEIATSSK